MQIASTARGSIKRWSKPIPGQPQCVFAMSGVQDGTLEHMAYSTLRQERGSVTITRRGHYYASWDGRDELHNDDVCRGCGHHGHFDYILDYIPCTAPATAKGIRRVLQERV